MVKVTGATQHVYVNCSLCFLKVLSGHAETIHVVIKLVLCGPTNMVFYNTVIFQQQ